MFPYYSSVQQNYVSPYCGNAFVGRSFKIMETIINDGDVYNLEKLSTVAKLWVSDDERNCIVTDLDNKVLFEISSTTVCNTGFIKVA